MVTRAAGQLAHSASCLSPLRFPTPATLAVVKWAQPLKSTPAPSVLQGTGQDVVAAHCSMRIIWS